MKLQLNEKELNPNVILWFVIGLFFVLHLYNISAPPNGYHQWRESDTAAISLNFYQEDMNFLHPRVNQRGAGTGITGSELPIYNYAGAILYKLVGPSHAAHRMLTLLASLLSIWLLFQIIFYMTKNKNIAAYAAFALAFSPLFFFYSYKIMPDIWMLTFLLASVFFYMKYLEKETNSQLILSALMLVLSATIKPLSLSIYFLFFILSLKSNAKKSKTYIATLLFVMVTFIPTLGWYLYARSVNELYQTPGFYMGGMLTTFYKYLATPQFFKKLFLQWPFESWVGWMLVIFFVTGLFLLIKEKKKYGIFVWIFSCYMVFSIISYHSSSHDYYTLIILPPIAAITGVGINKIIQMKKYRNVIFILLFVVIPFTPFLRIHQRFIDVPNFDKIRSDANVIIPSNSLVMVEDPTTAIRLYQLNKKGWPLRDTITYSYVKQLIDEGGDFIILENEIDKYDDSLKYLFETQYRKIDNLYCYPVQK